MKNLDILIIEDTQSECELLSKLLIENNYNIAGRASNYKDALKLFYEKKIDLIIIDVFLNGIPDGITFAETICITPNACKPFIFLTSSKDRQIFERAKLSKPFGFLMKPYNELEVLYAIEMAIEKFYNQINTFENKEQNVVLGNDYLFVKKKNSLKKIYFKDIIYVEVEERYCNLITPIEKFIITISLTKISSILTKDKFIKTHRNFIVNLDKIIEIIPADNLVILEGNHKILLSDKYKGFINDLKLLK